MSYSRSFFALIGVAALLFATACPHHERRPIGVPLVSEGRPDGSSWQGCGYPANARAESGWAKLRAYVDAEGVVLRVQILAESERAFGDHAGKCALAMPFLPALSPDGEPIPSWTPPFMVRFQL